MLPVALLGVVKKAGHQITVFYGMALKIYTASEGNLDSKIADRLVSVQCCRKYLRISGSNSISVSVLEGVITVEKFEKCCTGSSCVLSIGNKRVEEALYSSIKWFQFDFSGEYSACVIKFEKLYRRVKLVEIFSDFCV